MIAKYKKLIIIVILIIAAFFGYSIFFGETDTSGNSLLTSTASTSPENSTDILGADIIRAINQIDSLNLDRSVFDDPILNRLVDRSEKLNEEPKQRDNPFAPIGDVSFSTSTSTDSIDNGVSAE